MEEIQKILLDTYGYSSFRDRQEEVIKHVISKKDSLVIMPTGGGKSVCFQIPALYFPNITIVVSPLIALMKDQVESLKQVGVNAAAYNSTMDQTELAKLENDAMDGKLKIIYVSPEKLNTIDFYSLLKRIKISLFAIDEAHCVSMWGNDFRPEYKRIGNIRQEFINVPFIALTATADNATQDDIVQQLKLNNAKIFVSSFERKNIKLIAMPAQKRLEEIKKFLLNKVDQSGIIYCLSRKGTENLAESLKSLGYPCAAYHAGMSNEARSEVQEKFLNDDLQIICATIAFGMGIDKSNIRWIVHYNMPKNLESYYQEIGRAGRDGMDAEALLFYGFMDVEMLREFAMNSENGTDEFINVQLAKIERMWECATATECRTNIILNYFGEYREGGCGHCDNCLFPQEKFDGSILAQKAISAILRCNEQLTANMLIDVLRGSRRKEIMDKGFHEIKTFGAGRERSPIEWKAFLSQMINQGLIRIDFTDSSRLKTTPLSQKVLRAEVIVNLVEIIIKQKVLTKPKLKHEQSNENSGKERIIEEIKVWRKNEAERQKVPPYVILHDSTINNIVSHMPNTTEELLDIQGMGKVKVSRYGNQILTIIKSEKSSIHG